jgi:hypothetical protein
MCAESTRRRNMAQQSDKDERFGHNGDDLIASDNARRRALIPSRYRPHRKEWQPTTPISTRTSSSEGESSLQKE